MPRDDSALYTGVTSTSYRKNAERKKQERGERASEASKLLPVAEVVLELIDKERTRVSDVSSFIYDTKTTNEQLAAQMQARAIHLDFLTKFQAQIENRLRVQG